MVTLGNLILVIDLVSTVVVTGCWDQLSKPWKINIPAPMNPLSTAHIQKALLNAFVWAMNPSP